MPPVRFSLALALAAAAGSMPALAQRQMSAAQLTAFVKSSIQLRQDDREIADYVRKLRLTERLDDKTVQELEGMGAGPRTVAALKRLETESANLPPAPAPASPAPVIVLQTPGAEEQQRILGEVTENALAYGQQLPNFVCTQVTRRRVDPTGSESWRPDGVIQEQLSYVDHHEDYKVMLVNDAPARNIGHNQVGGNRSSGEFGSMLQDIFDPSSRARFEWERWATLRGRRMHVFSYRIEKPFSKYTIRDDPSGQSVVPGYHGLIYADSDTLKVMRITMDCDDIPPSFPIQEARETLDYDFADISGQKFLLPLKADLRFRGGRALVWNEIEFRLYHKYTTDATITFAPVDDSPIPADQLEEQPAK